MNSQSDSEAEHQSSSQPNALLDKPVPLDSLGFEVLQPVDAEGVTSLVKLCYGDDYHYSFFYHPEKIRDMLQARQLYSVVAKEPSGKVIAHMAMLHDRPEDKSAENMAGMMPSHYRGMGVLSRLGTVIAPLYLNLKLVGLQIYSVTHHLISQRIGINSGATACGCLLADSPGTNAYGLEFDERKAIVMQYHPFRPAPLRVLYLPKRYHGMVANILERLGFPFLFSNKRYSLSLSKSIIDTKSNASRGTALLRFTRLGCDVFSVTEQFFNAHTNSASIYVDIPLTQVSAVTAIDQLKDLGCFFGGIIFEQANTDFLRLQWTREPPLQALSVYDEFGKTVAAFVYSDHLATRRVGD